MAPDVWTTTDPPAFALLHRPETTGPDVVEVVAGELTEVSRLDDVPVPAANSATDPTGTAGHDVLVLLPFRQLGDRGFVCHDDGEPILALTAEHQERRDRDELLAALPAGPVALGDGRFEPDDAAYEEIVRRVLTDEIGQGAGSNFVIHRVFHAEVGDEPLTAALTLFRALLERERGAYWTFLVHTGERTFVGASPERHVSLDAGTVVMNPISGTLRYPERGTSVGEVLTFLADPKESDELSMVVDEELKMMARMCDRPARVRGPWLKEMGRLAHTEYVLQGRSDRDVRTVLRETMFAPTVTGSPIENACRVIARHETVGRSYYSGVVATIGHDAAGERTLDSAILIRTADIARDGALRMGVGATLVRDSDPAGEVAETRAKAEGLLSSARPARRVRRRDEELGDHPQVVAALRDRNTGLSRYWLHAEEPGPTPLAGRRGLLIDAEDTFTGMLASHIAGLGGRFPVRSWAEVTPGDLDDVDVVVLGPGPGDPADTADPRIARLRDLGGHLLRGPVPFLAVCLGHQVISSLLGLPIRRLDPPHQGTQRLVPLFGRRHRLGFYNTFSAVSDADTVDGGPSVGPVAVSRDPASGEVHGLSAERFATVQFHPESVLSHHGHALLGRLLGDLLPPGPDLPVAS